MNCLCVGEFCPIEILSAVRMWASHGRWVLQFVVSGVLWHTVGELVGVGLLFGGTVLHAATAWAVFVMGCMDAVACWNFDR
jgi:hypothetical protein